MSGWSTTINTIVSAFRDLYRWRTIKKVKEYENDKAVIDELERRRVAEFYKLQMSDDDTKS